jgi:hypothetical protein
MRSDLDDVPKEEKIGLMVHKDTVVICNTKSNCVLCVLRLELGWLLAWTGLDWTL